MSYYNPERGVPLEDSPLYHLLVKYAPEALPNLVRVYFSDITFNMHEDNLLSAFGWRYSADGALFWSKIYNQIWYLYEKEQL